MDRDKLKATLAQQPVLADVLSHTDQEALQQVLEHPGLSVIWGLMLGARQAQFQALAYAPLGTAPDMSRASVIQGTIRGIELFHDTVVEQAVSSRTDGAKE